MGMRSKYCKFLWNRLISIKKTTTTENISITNQPTFQINRPTIQQQHHPRTWTNSREDVNISLYFRQMISDLPTAQSATTEASLN